MSQLRPSVHKIEIEPIKPSYVKLVPGTAVKSGITVNTSEYKEVSMVDNYGQLPSSDFTIANYQALGMTTSLSVTKFSNHDIDGVTSIFEQFEQNLNNTKNVDVQK